MNYVGDFAEDATVILDFTTNAGDGSAVEPSDPFEVADFKIYKDGGATERASMDGVSLVSTFDGSVGSHVLAIDTSVETGDAGFWVANADYFVKLDPDETVDGLVIVSHPGRFSIENRYTRGTNLAALATVCTEARLAELAAANLPADIDTLITRLTANRAGYLDELAAANLPTDISDLNTLINAIDTSTELAARFTELKGAGWTTETLKAIMDAIALIPAPAGARTITFQLYETGGSTPIADVDVSVYNVGQSIHIGTKKTDVNGQVIFGLDDATYEIVSQKAAWTFTTPETVVVSAIATKILYGDTTTVPLPGNPESCNIICDLKGFGLAAKEGVVFTATLFDPPQAVSSAIINPDNLTDTTDVTGRAILTVPQGIEFNISSDALGGDSKAITVDTTGLSSIILADEVS